MKPAQDLHAAGGFSLVELLVVVAIIGLLASLLLPVIAKAPGRAREIKCLSNLRQIGIAFHTFASDHDGRYPMRVSTNQGGSREYAGTWQTYRHFRALSSQLETPRILICPSDTRQSASNWPGLRNRNLSYFVGLDATPGRASSVLAGDRNITRVPVTGGAGVVINSTASWTADLHHFRGNLLLSDDSTHRTDDRQLRDYLTGAARVSN